MANLNEDPLNPGDDPTGEPLGTPVIEFDEEIKGLAVKIQCTWANCFTEPVWDRGLCIRSYDRAVLKANRDITGIIGVTTGNYCIDYKKAIWIEAKLNYTNRRDIGWFRESDIWHEKKGTIDPNSGDTPKAEKKKFNWLTWLVTGSTLLRIIS